MERFQDESSSSTPWRAAKRNSPFSPTRKQYIEKGGGGYTGTLRSEFYCRVVETILRTGTAREKIAFYMGNEALKSRILSHVFYWRCQQITRCVSIIYNNIK